MWHFCIYVKGISDDKKAGEDGGSRLGEKAMDAVVDSVAGPCFSGMINVLNRANRFSGTHTTVEYSILLSMQALFLIQSSVPSTSSAISPMCGEKDDKRYGPGFFLANIG